MSKKRRRKELEEKRLDIDAALRGTSISREADKILKPRREAEAAAAAAIAAAMAAAGPGGSRFQLASKLVSRSQAQDSAILEALKAKGYDPRALPKAEAGKAGVKAEIRADLLKSCRNLFVSAGVFDTAWQRLRDDEQIADPTG